MTGALYSVSKMFKKSLQTQAFLDINSSYIPKDVMSSFAQVGNK
jgi:hypothetical protein